MSLYGSLPQTKSSSTEGSSWAAVPKLQPTLRKPGGMFAPPPSVLKAAGGRGGGRSGPPPAGRGMGRGGSSSAPASDSGPSSSGHDGPSAVPKFEPAPAPSNASSSSIFAINGPIMEEDRLQAKMAEERARAAALVLASAAPLEQQRQREGLSAGRQAAGKPSGSSRVGEEDESDLEAAGVYFGGGEPPSSAAAAAAAAAAGNVKGMSFAQRMLEKMGWKEGDGLGKHRHGMSTPLIAQKTDKRSGIIVNASEAPPSAGVKRAMSTEVATPASVTEKKQRTGAFMYGVPSRVLCMRNMVGPGEVDEDLEEEFDRIESATKAVVDLQARFFGGRTVRVSFFSEQRFDKVELAPAADEFE
ncbi:MAG: hypothetical protein WDW38_003608 [Sanguina aurantia]